MQATVRSFDPATRSGTLLFDDGREVPYAAAAFARSGLRHLRIGQRVDVTVDGEGDQLAVRSLTLYTLHD